MTEKLIGTHPLRSTQENDKGDTVPHVWRANRFRRLFSIQNKIIVPYLAITLLVAAIGTYIVTRLVAGSLQERLSNQLVESGRVATDSIVRTEQSHLEVLRLITFSSGVDLAIQDNDEEFIRLLVNSLADNANIPYAVVLNAQGEPLYIRGSFGSSSVDFRSLPAVQRTLAGETDEQGDKFGEVYPELDPPLFAISAPVYVVESPDEIAGAVLVGTPLADVLPTIKREALADVIIYDMDGAVVSSTFVLSEADRANLALTADDVQTQLDIIARDNNARTLEIGLNERSYQGLYVPLRVRGEVQGLMAVFLPSDFIVLAGGTSARIFAVLFGGAAFMIILIGLYIASTIINPVRRLVELSQSVTAGDLTRRSNVKTHDEIGFLGFTFDIMTQRLAERTYELQAEAARLNTILETSQTGMVMINRERELAFMNRTAFNFLNPVIDAASLRKLCQDLLALKVNDRLEIGNYILATETTRVVNDQREFLGTLVALHDITREELAGQLKDQFIARVSHELRTPLTAIKGYSDLVAAMVEMNKPPKLDHVESISRQTIILDKMIVELLDISQMSAGTFSIRRGKMDLRAIVLEVVEDKKPEIEAAELALEVHIAPEPCKMNGDAKRLSWAIHHVFDNAIKYTLPEGRILCELSAAINGFYHVVITDNGVGIRPIDQSFVFDAYYRREAVTPTGDIIDPRGMGLGLYVVRNVLKAHGGIVSLESTPGRGSTFSLVIPVGD